MRTEFNAKIGDRLRSYRLAKGLRIDDLAKASQVHRATIINIEQGHHAASYKVLLRLADALGVEVGDLTGIKDF